MGRGTFPTALPRVFKFRSQEDPSNGQPCTRVPDQAVASEYWGQAPPDSAVATNLATLMVNMGAKGARCLAGV